MYRRARFVTLAGIALALMVARCSSSGSNGGEDGDTPPSGQTDAIGDVGTDTGGPKTDTVEQKTTPRPMFSLPGGTYISAQVVGLTCAAPGARIYYTEDGTEPTETSTLYADEIPIDTTTILKAVAKAEGLLMSEVNVATYTIEPIKMTVEPPTIHPPSGTFDNSVQVELACPTAGAEIHYTLDGNPPNAGSPIYAAPITLGVGTTDVKAMAILSGMMDSPVVTTHYVVKEVLPITAAPVLTPAGGAVAYGSTVTITSTTPGAVLYYTTDGSYPAGPEQALVYKDPIAVTATFTLSARAQAEGMEPSAVTQGSYTVKQAPFADICAAWNAAFAARQVECLHANPDTLAGRPGVLDCATLKADIDAGDTTYNESLADACTAALQALPCAGLIPSGYGPLVFPIPGTACQDILKGTRPSGPPESGGLRCHRNTQCSSGYCTSTGQHSCAESQCENRVGAGKSCEHSAQCTDGLACISGACAVPGAAGDMCYHDSMCGAGLVCPNGKCEPPLAEGGTWCSMDRQCVAGNTCVSGTCKALVGAGGACTPAIAPGLPTECGIGYWCSAGTCVAYPKVGESCVDSRACTGGYCDLAGNEPTCVAYLGTGASCTSSTQCASGLASFDKCVAPGDYYCTPS